MGFDISSTCIGWAVLEINEKDENKIKYKDSGVIFPAKDKEILDKLFISRNEINILLKKYKPDDIAIEDIIKFMKGKSSANTITTLTAFNRMVGLCSFDYLSKSPTLYNVLSIRHGIKLTKKLPDKTEIPEVVAKLLNIKYDYKIGKKGKVLDENFDRADALAVAVHFGYELLKLPKPSFVPKISKIK